MLAKSGPLAGISALVCIVIACEFCGATRRAIGNVCVHTGICGHVSTIIVRRGGSGVSTDVLGGTNIANAFSNDGPVLNGWLFENTGTCGDAIDSTMACMVVSGGLGVHSSALVCTVIGSAPSSGIYKVDGAKCALTGTCGSTTTTTNHGAGLGGNTDALVSICTVIAC